jgi:hypothetical protein
MAQQVAESGQKSSRGLALDRGVASSSRNTQAKRRDGVPRLARPAPWRKESVTWT